VIKKVDGKTAIQMLVERKHGFHSQLTEGELRHLRQRAQGFYLWLRSKQLSHEETDQIIDRIIDSTKRELERDWQEQFYISDKRVERNMAVEVDIFGAKDEAPESEKLEQECEEDHDYWLSVEKTAEVHAERLFSERWHRAMQHMEAIDARLTEIELDGKMPEELPGEEIALLLHIEKKLRMLRFGKSKGQKIKKIESFHKDGIYISATAWKKTQNRINLLLGREKRYVVAEQQEKKESTDAMDVSVYGVDLDNRRM
jgi:hypothetical protein